MHRPSQFLTVLAALLPAGAAFADACATVKGAYDKLATAPAYRQTVAMPGRAPMQIMAIGDMLYMNQGDGKWMTLPMKPGMRAQMMQQTIPEAASLSDCREIGPDSLEGAAMTIIEYRPPPIEGLDGGLQRVWIGDADGLPHKMTGAQGGQAVDVTLSFENVTPPAE